MALHDDGDDERRQADDDRQLDREPARPAVRERRYPDESTHSPPTV